MTSRNTDHDLVTIDTSLVKRLVASQFPQWANLPIRPVKVGGWDNRTFHLGTEMTVRLPSHERYSEQVAKEQAWLPILAPQLPLPIPVPLGRGVPTDDFPRPWSVYNWIGGETAASGQIANLKAFAVSLAEFLNALKAIDATGGPAPGTHNFFRGGALATYDGETREALEKLRGQIDTDLARDVWERALATQWEHDPVWFHGDIAVGNLLLQDGRLSAVIDFGTSGVGDPACDLAITWTLFTGESREAFRSAMQYDGGTWARGRAWTLWKALIVAAGQADTNAAEAEHSFRIINEVLDDFQQHGIG